ncbi:MAG: thiamine diphosphokinase [Bacillota bacterium]|nr:thiamine diphosphokinase [Bacillota bacterium]
MIINILGGGPVDLLPDLHNYNEKESIWVGVDRGVFTLINRDIQPDIAFGDFDSVTANELTEIEKKVKHLEKFKPEKDETDMELALNWALEQKPDQIRVFGSSGGRLDHFFANVQLVIRPVLAGTKTEIFLIDRNNVIFVKAPGKYEIRKMDEKKYISFVPVTLNVQALTLDGFKYPLKDCHISIGSTLCISNELIRDCGTFSFSEGILIVVRSND